MNSETRVSIINAVNDVAGLQGMAEVIADHIIVEGTRQVTIESLTEIKFRPGGADREKSVTPAAAKRVMAAISFYHAIESSESKIVKKSKPYESIVTKFLDDTTEDQRKDLAYKSADLRMTFEGKRPMSWASVRKELGLNNSEFHKVIRISDHYKRAIVNSIQNLLESGWFYENNLEGLAGIILNKSLLDRNNSNLETSKKSE